MMDLLSTGQPKNLGRFLSRISFSRRVVLGARAFPFFFFFFILIEKNGKFLTQVGFESRVIISKNRVLFLPPVSSILFFSSFFLGKKGGGEETGEVKSLFLFFFSLSPDRVNFR